MSLLRTEVGLVFKHVSKHAEKVNAVNYQTRAPPPYDYIYEKDENIANDQMGSFLNNAQASNQDNWDQSQGNQGRDYTNYNREGNYVYDGNYNHDKNYKRNRYGNMNDKSGPYVPPWK
uniref:Integrase core domain containing protein n=1 Tax=Solanum tuberosum TaxID=4113 RepID=M1DCB3_SOLTU